MLSPMHLNATRRAALPAALLLLLAAAARPVSTQQTPPVRTLAGGSEPVSIDFVVLGRDGLPVLDLKAEEVTLRVDSKTRIIKSLRLITPGQGQGPAGGGEPPPAPFGSNTIGDAGRTIVLIVDDETVRPGNESPMKSAISQFLSDLGQRDQVALATVPHGGIKVNFTTAHDEIRRAVTMITGQAPQRENADEASCRTRNTLQQLTSTIDVLGRSVGPTTVAVFTSSLMGARSAVTISSAGRGGGVNNIGMCEILPEEFQRVGAAAAIARANLYIIQHDPVLASEIPAPAPNQVRGSDSPRAGIENLAGVTGGTMLALAGGSDTSLSRILRETSSYWVATFDAEPQERNGGSHQVSVRVSRDNTTVRSRPDMIIARADGSAVRNTATTPQAMMLEARVFTDLPIRAAGYTARNADGRLKVVALAEPVDPSVTITAASAGLFDSSGRLTAQWTAEPGELGGPLIMSALPAPPGTYRLRVALADSTGHRGSADYEVVSELMPAGPLKLSAIVLGLSRGGAFRPKLQFTNEPVALACFEIYGGQAGARISVVIELAQTVNGPAFIAMPAAVAATREEDRFEVTAAVPIGALPSGDYVVRAIVGMDGQTEGRIVRTLRKAQ